MDTLMVVPDKTNLPLRCLSIDVEEYFHIEAAHGTVRRGEWDTLPSRVERNVDLLLELFARHGHKATFFILGDVARRNPTVAPKHRRGGARDRQPRHQPRPPAPPRPPEVSR